MGDYVATKTSLASRCLFACQTCELLVHVDRPDPHEIMTKYLIPAGNKALHTLRTGFR